MYAYIYICRMYVEVDVDIDRYFGCFKGPQSQLRYFCWYRSSHGTDFDISEIAGPVNCGSGLGLSGRTSSVKCKIRCHSLPYVPLGWTHTHSPGRIPQKGSTLGFHNRVVEPRIGGSVLWILPGLWVHDDCRNARVDSEESKRKEDRAQEAHVKMIAKQGLLLQLRRSVAEEIPLMLQILHHPVYVYYTTIIPRV